MRPTQLTVKLQLIAGQLLRTCVPSGCLFKLLSTCSGGRGLHSCTPGLHVVVSATTLIRLLGFSCLTTPVLLYLVSLASTFFQSLMSYVFCFFFLITFVLVRFHWDHVRSHGRLETFQRLCAFTAPVSSAVKPLLSESEIMKVTHKVLQPPPPPLTHHHHHHPPSHPPSQKPLQTRW